MLLEAHSMCIESVSSSILALCVNLEASVFAGTTRSTCPPHHAACFAWGTRVMTSRLLSTITSRAVCEASRLQPRISLWDIGQSAQLKGFCRGLLGLGSVVYTFPCVALGRDRSGVWAICAAIAGLNISCWRMLGKLRLFRQQRATVNMGNSHL